MRNIHCFAFLIFFAVVGSVSCTSSGLRHLLKPSCTKPGIGYIEAEKKVLVTRDTGSKSGYETVEETVKVRHHCVKCGSFYCPKPDCCGIVSDRVLARATGQSGTGEPSIGLIPTMKTLAPPLNN